VIEKVVVQDLCIGCGVCAGMCPRGLLSMKFNKFGEYNACLDKPCEINCELCLKVCPFSAGNDNEDALAKELYADTGGIKHHKATGYYLKSYYGYSLENEHRANGSSGGLTTWLLEHLLVHKRVDRVVCVTSNDDPEKLFRFQVFDSVEGVRKAAGSAYYPIELSEVIKFIMINEGSFALVGLPCFVKAIRLAQKNNPKLRERVRFLIGLVCGQLKSKHYTRFISAMAGVTDKPSTVYYRKKHSDKASSNFAFEVKGVHGKRAEICFQEGVGSVWTNKWFTPQSCSYCDDTFAELADIVLMDAWLPEYVSDSKGANLLIIRTADIDELIVCAAAQKRIYAAYIPLKRIIQSQAGVLKFKRDQLAYRLHLAEKYNGTVIVKRVVPANRLNFFAKKEVEIKERMRVRSRDEFLKIETLGQKETSLFLKKDLKNFLCWNGIYLYLLFPVRVLSKINRELRNIFRGK